MIIEHTIDERSPLIGHTFDSLVAVSQPCVTVTVRVPMIPPSHLTLHECKMKLCLCDLAIQEQLLNITHKLIAWGTFLDSRGAEQAQHLGLP